MTWEGERALQNGANMGAPSYLSTFSLHFLSIQSSYAPLIIFSSATSHLALSGIAKDHPSLPPPLLSWMNFPTSTIADTTPTGFTTTATTSSPIQQNHDLPTPCKLPSCMTVWLSHPTVHNRRRRRLSSRFSGPPL